MTRTTHCLSCARYLHIPSGNARLEADPGANNNMSKAKEFLIKSSLFQINYTSWITMRCSSKVCIIPLPDGRSLIPYDGALYHG